MLGKTKTSYFYTIQNKVSILVVVEDAREARDISLRGSSVPVSILVVVEDAREERE